MATSFGNIGKIPELKKRILFTLSLLAVYRIGVFVTVPGVDRLEMANYMGSGGSAGSFLGMFNMFSGGALEQLSIFALGIMPYISASIIIQLLTVVIPKLDELNKEGEAGRKKINQYTRYGTIGLSLIQSFFIATWLESIGAGSNPVVTDPGWSFQLMTVLTLTTGTAFIMWLGEQITERGVGNGISLIIFAGIVAAMPDGITQLFVGNFTSFSLILLGLIFIATVAIICYFELIAGFQFNTQNGWSVEKCTGARRVTCLLRSMYRVLFPLSSLLLYSCFRRKLQIWWVRHGCKTWRMLLR